ncbi:MAG: sulfite exporter TauE/SafE family protein, partial [Pseudomonadota bacterium]|nr:sulfite exporter TauE/SafE family protein [Pseudomonadota bacterium]
LGAVLIAVVPARRLLARWRGSLSPAGLGGAGAVYGFLAGGTAGTGIVLLAILLSAGLQGPAVVATDAAISLVIGVAKAAVFQTAGSLPLSLWILAILIGTVAIPGAFIARLIAYRLTLRAHTAILDGIVLAGGAILILQGLQPR